MRNPFARVAKHDTTRPSLKERATGLKATAARVMKRRAAASDAPSPALVGMVAEWERLLNIENTGKLTDEQMSPICHARYRLHAQICAYPAASIADLAAKLPLFREEVIANEPSDPRRPTMDYQSWCGIVSDLEAVGAMPSPTLAPVSARRDVMQMAKSGQGVLIGLDPKAMPMRTLDALCDHARTLTSVCYGLAAQPRSSGSDDNLNEAGTVMLRLAEEVLGRVIDTCEHEARRRVDATGHDRVVRAGMLARPIIEDEDPEELHALARDLVAMAKSAR